MNDITQANAILPFPSDSAEYEEYRQVMDELSDTAHDSAPDPIPDNFGGICEDAPCCGCCGNDIHNDCPDDPYDSDYHNSAPDDSYLDEEDSDIRDDEDAGGEDSCLDSYWEDQSEYGMDGCCGDF